MNRSIRDHGSAVVDRRRPRQRLLAGLLAVGIAFPTAAHPYTLDQLLRLPLERLLQIKIAAAPMRTATADGPAPDGVHGSEGHGHVT